MVMGNDMGIDDNLELLCTQLDSSYVLTADNTKKMLAILMRFRYYKVLCYVHIFVCIYMIYVGVIFQLYLWEKQVVEKQD